MKLLLSLLTIITLSSLPARAQCKDCGCQTKCSPSCECKHDQKPETR